MKFEQMANQLNSPKTEPIKSKKKPIRKRPFSITHETYVAANGVRNEEAWKHETYLAGKGSENLVSFFEDEKHKNIVYKVHYLSGKSVLKAYLSRSGERYANALLELKKSQKDRQEKLGLLREHFGHKTVPAEQSMIREMPISKELVKSLSKDDFTADELSRLPETTPVTVVAQRKVDMNSFEDVEEIVAFYPEAKLLEKHTDEEAADIYDEGHRVFLANKIDKDTDQKRLALRLYPDLERIMLAMKDNPELKMALHDWVSKAVTFTKEQKILLDLMGNENLVFVKKGKDWRPIMLDILIPFEINLNSLEELAEDSMFGRDFDKKTKTSFLAGFNAVRLINALAALLDIDDRVEVPVFLDVQSEICAQGFINMKSVIEKRRSREAA
ncbi:MAG: hypothetical protein WCT54_01350 [Patescibacteria group bacterium]